MYMPCTTQQSRIISTFQSLLSMAPTKAFFFLRDWGRTRIFISLLQHRDLLHQSHLAMAAYSHRTCCSSSAVVFLVFQVSPFHPSNTVPIYACIHARLIHVTCTCMHACMHKQPLSLTYCKLVGCSGVGVMFLETHIPYIHIHTYSGCLSRIASW
jgi:hypothetical protein